MKRIVKGEEVIILIEYENEGFVSIATSKLTKKMNEVFTEEALIDLAEKVIIPLAALKNMTFMAYIKSDIANKDVSGWKQHQKTLKDEGYDV